jgi:ribosomal protein S12 methylthiotransferase
MSKKLHMISLGCTKNLVDSEVMLGRLQNYEMTDESNEADVLIVNTCGFIDAAKEESINTILAMHETRKDDSVLVMAGCLSERYKAELQEELPEIDLFTGSGDYDKIDELIASKNSRFSDAAFLIDEQERVITGSSTHAYIKISEGCNQTCSFCAIPSFKGKLHSRSLISIEKEVKRLTEKGYFDFTFISQDSSSFMRDMGIKDGLVQLIHTIEKIEGVKSARILYFYPTTTSNLLLDTVAKSEIFNDYYDIPLQHIEDAMLKRMKRGMGEEQTNKMIQYIKNEPEAFVRTSFIVGHPGEDEATFQTMKTYIEESDFDMINLFAYSDEESTKAFDMNQKVNPEVIEARISELQEVVDQKLMRKLRLMIGKEITVVLNGISDEIELLYSAKNLAWCPDIDPEVLINETEVEELIAGKLYRCEIVDSGPNQLVGKILEEV